MASELTQSLPVSWEIRRLDEVATIIDSLHKTPSYSDVGSPMVRVTDVQGGFLDLSNTLRVSEEVFQEFTRRYAPKRGDMVFSRVGSYGNVSYAKTDTPFCLGQNTALISPRINGRFLHLFLQSPEARWQIEQVVVGSTQKTISLKSISALQIPIPPPNELEAIAAVLGALDDKIELNRRMNATLEEMARALFQSWFVDFDPVRAKLDGRQPPHLDPTTAYLFPDSFEDSPLGPVPKGWTVGKLGDIGSNSRRGVQPSDIAPNTPYIALEHMPRRCIALGDWDDSAEVASGKSAFKKGEILFGKLRPYFHKVGVAPFDGVCSTDILVLAPKSSEWFGFLLGHATSDELIQFTDLASTGTKMPRTNWSDISSFKVAMPPKPIAATFTCVIHPMLDRIHANLHQSRTLATLRDTLLPKLLSGELSVADVQSSLEAVS